MDQNEAREWVRGTVHCRALRNERSDPAHVLESTKNWMAFVVQAAHHQESKALMANHPESVVGFDSWSDESTSPPKSPNQCDHCARPGHRKDTCRKLEKCGHCGKLGHPKQDCWYLHRELIPDWVDSCTLCGKRFHTVESCRKNLTA